MQSEITISFRGGAGSGKTLLLASLLEAIADAGLFSTEDTKHITENPGSFLHKVRPPRHNLDSEEIATITIDKAVLLANHLAPPPEPRLRGVLEIDPALLQVMDHKQAIMRQFEQMLDAAIEQGVPLIPLTIDVQPYVIPAT